MAKRLKAIADRAGDHAKLPEASENEIRSPEERARLQPPIFTSGAFSIMANGKRQELQRPRQTTFAGSRETWAHRASNGESDRELRAIADPALCGLLRGGPDYSDLQLGWTFCT